MIGERDGGLSGDFEGSNEGNSSASDASLGAVKLLRLAFSPAHLNSIIELEL